MSKAKDLKTSPDNNINLYELFSLFAPDKKSKYADTLLRVMKKTKDLDLHVKEIKEKLNKEFDFSFEDMDNIPSFHFVFFWRIIDNMFNVSDLKQFQRFCELNERGLIKQNDLSRYNSFDEIINSLSVAEMIADLKEMEKQVKIVFENEEWLLVRPLTFASSKKYGSNTKWCTTTETNPEYFIKYASRGVLIYCINKINGYKVASFNSLDKNEREFSWWNQKDSRIDSLETELPVDLLQIVKEESTIKAKTNRFLLSDDERIKEDKALQKYGINYKKIPVQPDNMIAETEDRSSYISRAIMRAQMDEEPTVSMEQPTAEMEMGNWGVVEEREQEANYENRENLEGPMSDSFQG